MALRARRPLRLGFVGVSELTCDERAVLQVIAAAQAGDTVLMEAGAIWLTRPPAAASVARAAIGLAELLAAHGVLVVSERLPQTVQRPLSARIAAGESWIG